MADFYDIEKSLSNRKLYLKHCKDYKDIVTEFQKLDEVTEEMEKLSGHRHYMLDRIEDNIFDIVDRNDEVLLIKFGKYKMNLTDLLIYHKMEKVLMRAVENKDVVMQKDKLGCNAGIKAVFEEMENVALKIATEYPEAVLDKNCLGRTMGMYAARDGMVRVVSEIIQNKTALLQQDNEGDSIGMFAAKNTDLNPVMVDILKDEDAATQQNSMGDNIGIIAAKYSNKPVYDIAKQNQIAANQRNKCHETMIDIASEYGLESMIQTDESEIVGE